MTPALSPYHSDSKTRTLVALLETEPEPRTMLARVLEEQLHYQLKQFPTHTSLLDELHKSTDCPYEAILIDISSHTLQALEVIHRLQRCYPEISIVAMTHYGDTKQVSKALDGGAKSFLYRPVSHQQLQVTIDNAAELSRLRKSLAMMREQMDHYYRNDIHIDTLPFIENQLLHKLLDCIKLGKSPVLLAGEKGTGKSLVLQFITQKLPRGLSVVAHHCAATPDAMNRHQLLEDVDAKIRKAENGYLVLHDADHLSKQLQTELEAYARKLSVILLLTTQHISDTQGRFIAEWAESHQDARISFAPLRERRDEISYLAKYYLQRHCLRENFYIHEISPEAIALLQEYNWPGNLKQLERVLYRAVILCDQPILDSSHLLSAMPSDFIMRDAVKEPQESILRSRRLSLVDPRGNMRRLRDIEADMIYFAVNFYEGRISEVARKLGIGRSTLYRKLNELNIDVA